MNVTLSDSSRLARKQYHCYYCGQRIEMGEKHGYRTGVSYGDFWTMRFHPECDDYACEHWDACDWEGFLPGDEFERPMTAFCPEI